METKHRIYTMTVASVYPHYVAKAEKKGRTLIQGVVCGVRVEEVQDPLIRDMRYQDKLIDELAKGRSTDSIVRL